MLLVDQFKDRLHKYVEVTDLGELHWMLGIEIHRDHTGHTVYLSQGAYIDSILCHYNFKDLKPLSTPMDTHVQLTTKQAPSSTAEFAAMHNIPYHKVVGALNWAALATHPNIAFAVSTITHFAANPSPAHWEAIKHIFQYLAGTRNLWLTYSEMKHTLVGYANTDSSMAEDCHAISGYTFLIDRGTMSWSSKRQEIISLSTTESEYIAATHSMKEVLWLHSLLSQVFGKFKSAMVMFSDNQAIIALTCNHQYHVCTKHINVCYHWICWVVEQGTLWLVLLPLNLHFLPFLPHFPLLSPSVISLLCVRLYDSAGSDDSDDSSPLPTDSDSVPFLDIQGSCLYLGRLLFSQV